MPDSIRPVARVIDSVVTLEGAGFQVRRPFPTHTLSELDPFLLLDEMGPMDLGPGEAKGAPDHPHRGFETVTYMLSGAMVHRDSNGSSGRIGPGDVQWMTAGAGVVHSELPDEELMRNGGRMHGFQLWVNLPRRDKMMRPRYQEVAADRIPLASADGVTVRVIAGTALGATAVIDTRTPIFYLHFTLQPGAVLRQPADPELNVFAYVIEGHGRFSGRDGGDGQMVVFAPEGNMVEITAGDQALDLLLIGGVPLGEPVARHGPFVMNTHREILQAIDDFQNGRMGRIEG